MSTDDRPEIPEPIKREVRQRCSFGCVLCGLPVYHYDHMIEYNEVQEHKADNITLLCPNHHQDKTSKRLPYDLVRTANDAPYNRANPATAWQQTYYSLDNFEFWLGDIRLRSDPSNFGDGRIDGVNVDGATVIGVRWRNVECSLGLWMRLCDDANRPFLQVRDGELRLSTALWDITNEGTTVTIRDALGVIRLVFEYGPTRFHIKRADFWVNRYHFLVQPDGPMTVAGFVLGGLTLDGGACIIHKGGWQERAPQPIMFPLGEAGRGVA